MVCHQVDFLGRHEGTLFCSPWSHWKWSLGGSGGNQQPLSCQRVHLYLRLRRSYDVGDSTATVESDDRLFSVIAEMTSPTYSAATIAAVTSVKTLMSVGYYCWLSPLPSGSCYILGLPSPDSRPSSEVSTRLSQPCSQASFPAQSMDHLLPHWPGSLENSQSLLHQSRAVSWSASALRA